MLTLMDYLYFGALAILGQLFAVLLQMKAQTDKAKKANLIPPSFKGFVGEEWINISLALLTILIAMFLIQPIIGLEPKYITYIRIAALPIGYMGTDIILKMFGVVNNRLNAAIDYKTTEADKITGTLDAPTVAAPTTPKTP